MSKTTKQVIEEGICELGTYRFSKISDCVKSSTDYGSRMCTTANPVAHREYELEIDTNGGVVALGYVKRRAAGACKADCKAFAGCNSDYVDIAWNGGKSIAVILNSRNFTPNLPSSFNEYFSNYNIRKLTTGQIRVDRDLQDLFSDFSDSDDRSELPEQIADNTPAISSNPVYLMHDFHPYMEQLSKMLKKHGIEHDVTKL